MSRLEPDLIRQIYEMATVEAFRNVDLLNAISKAGGLIQFIDLFVNGEKACAAPADCKVSVSDLKKFSTTEKESQENINEVEILQAANKVLLSNLKEKERALDQVMDIFNNVLTKWKVGKNSVSIKDLEDKFKVNIDDNSGRPIGEIQIPKDIVGESKIDAEVEKRIKGNLMVEDDPSKFPIKNISSDLLVELCTREVNGRLQVATFLNTMLNGKIISKKVIRDWEDLDIQDKII